MADFTPGQAWITPDEVVAGQFGTWTLTYQVGTLGLDEGGRLKVSFYMGADFGTPQFNDPAAPNYVSVFTDGAAQIIPTFRPQGSTRPYMRTIELLMHDGALTEGEHIVLVLGDRRSGSPGMRGQTFAETQCVVHVSLDPFQSDVFRTVAKLALWVRSGPPRRLHVLGPGLVRPGDPFCLGVRVEDEWGNPCSDFAGDVHLTPSLPVRGLPAVLVMTPADAGAMRLDGLQVADAAGPENVAAPLTIAAKVPGADLQGVSNPGLMAIGALRLFWGDIHGQTFETAGTGTMPEYFEFARRAAALDFSAHTAHDFQLSDAVYAELQQTVQDFHQPGRFVTFLAFEWSANTPNGGDHNVYYLGDDGPLYRCSDWMAADNTGGHRLAYKINDLYRVLRRDHSLDQVMVVPHVGGRRANLAFHDPELEPVVEICSGHGRFEWFYDEALERGYKVGVTGNSDDVTCRPGGNFPTNGPFGHRSGLTAVLAPELTRAAIWAAIRSRRCYATSGDRIFLDFNCGPDPMGSAVRRNDPPAFQVRVVGTGPIARVELKRGARVVDGWPRPSAADLAPDRFTITWGGTASKGRHKHALWDGRLALEGPGTICSAQTAGFYHPDHGLREVGEQAISWTSRTVGDRHTLAFALAAATAETRLRFMTAPLQIAFRPADVGPEGLYYPAGGADRFVEIRRQPLVPPPTAVDLTLADPEAGPGTHPYYVRVIQENGEMAWSSPIFVTLG